MATASEPYASYEGFLRAAIKTYWASGQGSKVNFLALLLASRETWQVAWDKVATPESGKKLLLGTAGVAAVTLLLRTVLGGPIGLLLTGASLASLVAIYAKNHKQIWERAERYKDLIVRYRGRFEKVRAEYIDGAVRQDQRDLMIDGLMSRFLVELEDDGPPAPDGEGEEVT